MALTCEPFTRKRKLVSYLFDDCAYAFKRSELRNDYTHFYDESVALPRFAHFGARVEFKTGASIPELASFFDGFDPINSTLDDGCVRFTARNHIAGPAAYEHVAAYLLSDEFDESLLSERTHDSTIHALVSYVLPWREERLRHFSEYHDRCRAFIEALLQETFMRDDGAYVYLHLRSGVPFVRTAFKILRNTFETLKPKPPSTPSMPTFSLVRLLPRAFVDYLCGVYQAIRSGAFDYEMMRRLVEQPDVIPYDIRSEIGDYETLSARARLKFVTGQACCGKTTLLNAMRRKGWRIVSRGSIGTFSGKTNNPVAVACLHASIDWALRHDNVLGDRGHIDNPLWVGIMQFCDPRHEDTLVADLLNFISDNFNAATLGFFIEQRGAVFIDLYPDKCAQRMLKRGTGGDPFRGRIASYAIVQTIAYLMVAKLFGWRLYCVPYDASGEHFDPNQYREIVEEMHAYFGTVGADHPLPTDRYGKPAGLLTYDAVYPKSVGIYK